LNSNLVRITVIEIIIQKFGCTSTTFSSNQNHEKKMQQNREYSNQKHETKMQEHRKGDTYPQVGVFFVILGPANPKSISTLWPNSLSCCWVTKTLSHQ